MTLLSGVAHRSICSGYTPRLDHRDEGPAAIYLGRARGALVDIILPYAFLCYGSPCASVGVSSARNCFSAWCLSETSPLGIDILGTEQQHFVVSRRFSLDRNFTVVYIATSDSGDRDSASGRPIHPGNIATSSDATCRVKPRHRGGASTLRRRHSQCCRRGKAQTRRRSEWLPGYARGTVLVFRCFEIPGESNLAAVC